MAKLTIIPPIMENESIPGYLHRVAWLNQYISMSDLAQEFGVGRLYSPQVYSRYLSQLCSVAPEVFSSFEAAIEEHSTIPAARIFYPRDAYDKMIDELSAETVKSGRHLSDSIWNRRMNYVNLRLCAGCVKSDYLRFGFAYWHREHEFAGISHCPYHGNALTKGCGRCESSKQLSSEIRLPAQECWCGKPHGKLSPSTNVMSVEAKLAVSRIWLHLLNNTTPAARLEEVLDAYRLRLAQTEYFKKNGSFHVKRLLNRLKTLLGRPAFHVIWLNDLAAEAWIRVLHTARVPVGNLQRHISLIAVLWDSAEAFTSYLAKESQSAPPFSDKAATRPTTRTPSILRDNNEEAIKRRRDRVRARILKHIEDEPTISLTMLCRKIGMAYGFITQYDLPWWKANVHVPLVARRVVARDKEMVKTLLARKRRAMSMKGQPTRITKSYLFACEAPKINRSRTRDLPSTSALLKRIEEPVAIYNVRWLRWFYTHAHEVGMPRQKMMARAIGRTKMKTTDILLVWEGDLADFQRR